MDAETALTRRLPIILIPHPNRRPHLSVCGQCCVATLTNSSLEQAIKACGKNGATSYHHLMTGLEVLGAEHSQHVIRDLPPLTGTHLVSVRGKHIAHWAIIHEGLWLDPSYPNSRMLASHLHACSYLEITKLPRPLPT